MAERYLKAAVLAFLAFGGTCALVLTPLQLAHGRNPIPAVATVWFVYGIPSLIVLTLLLGPFLLLVRPALGDKLSLRVAATLGVASGPLLLLAAWLVFREHNETLPGLLSFWWRVPGEFLAGVLPHSVAAMLFCAQLVARTGSGTS